MLVKLSLIDPSPYQTRSQDPAHIIKLAYSILKNGLLQPPVGRWIPDDQQIQRFQLAFGNSRLGAYYLLHDIASGVVPIPAGGSGPEWILYSQIVAEAEASGKQFDEMEVIEKTLNDEEMFVYGVSENVDRGDLKPIELAKAIHFYMEHFFKSSDEAGRLFRLSGSAIRNYLRLLNLPDEIQQKINAGDISQSTARKLLTVQKIVPEKDMLVTLEAIANAPDTQPQAIDQVIASRLDGIFSQSPNTILMMESWRSGPARGGEGLWLLDQWTFSDPQKFSAADFLKHYPDWKDTISSISEKPTTVIMNIVDMIMQGQRDPRFILSELEMDPEVYLPLVEQIIILMVPPVCTSCPFYRILNLNRGLDHYCGFRMCHARKKKTYIDDEITRIAYELGLAIYQKTDGAYIPIHQSDASQVAKFEARSDDLRVMLNIQGYKDHDFTGSRIVQIVDINPEAVAAEKTRKESNSGVGFNHDEYVQQMKQRALVQSCSLEFIWREVIPEMIPALNKIPKTLLDGLALIVRTQASYVPDLEFPRNSGADLTPQQIRQLIALSAIRSQIGYSTALYLTDSEGINQEGLDTILEIMKLFGIDVSAETWAEKAVEFRKKWYQDKEKADEDPAF